MTQSYLLRPVGASLASTVIVQQGDTKVLGRGDLLNISHRAVSRTQCVVEASSGLSLRVQKNSVHIVQQGSQSPLIKLERGAEVQVGTACSKYERPRTSHHATMICGVKLDGRVSQPIKVSSRLTGPALTGHSPSQLGAL
jgi:hypothetical protein